ncbi:MAG: type II secretion system F family protein [Microthrixaceae bacterium]|nr:type II secretion system F family protein [Microthrixaceae bacterium]
MVNATDRLGEVPIVADLLAVAVAAGVPVRQGLIDVGAVLRARGGAAPVVAAGDRLQRGAELSVVLDTIAKAGVGWHALATHLSLSVDSGVSAEGTLRRLAAQERLRIRRERERRARRLPVLLLLPLTTMVLPAFVAVTVVPFVVAGGISLELPRTDQGETGNHDQP